MILCNTHDFDHNFPNFHFSLRLRQKKVNVLWSSSAIIVTASAEVVILWLVNFPAVSFLAPHFLFHLIYSRMNFIYTNVNICIINIIRNWKFQLLQQSSSIFLIEEPYHRKNQKITSGAI